MTTIETQPRDMRLAFKTRLQDRRRAAALVAALQPFSNSTGTIRGIVGPPDDLGQLPPDWVDQFPSSGIQYTILSFATPIAWLHDGRWTMPDVRYSQTTTIHQGWVRWPILDGQDMQR